MHRWMFWLGIVAVALVGCSIRRSAPAVSGAPTAPVASVASPTPPTAPTAAITADLPTATAADTPAPAAVEPTRSPTSTAGPTNTATPPTTDIPAPVVTQKPTSAPRPTATRTPTPAPKALPGADPVLLGAGDITDCAGTDDEATAELLEGVKGTVITLGDNAYDDGTNSQFAGCYGPSWGRYKARTRPAPGNHEYHTAGAVGYYDYFGAAAGDPTKGYYSYNRGRWHIIVINSNCDDVGGCGAGSPQERWVRRDLAAHPTTCTLAYWHHPRFSSGEHGSETAMRPVWQALYEAGADVVLNGHDHDYERFYPQDADGVADPAHGIREFVVGTGGKSLRPFQARAANSEIRNNDTFGVIKLTLHATGYDWKFVPVSGATFTDSGRASCHSGRPPGRAGAGSNDQAVNGRATDADASGNSTADDEDSDDDDDDDEHDDGDDDDHDDDDHDNDDDDDDDDDDDHDDDDD